MTEGMNLNVNFLGDKLVLAVSEDDPDLDKKLHEFGRLSFGKQRITKLVQNGSPDLIPLTEYILQREERSHSPELKALSRRIDAESAARQKLEKRLDALVKAVENLGAAVGEKLAKKTDSGTKANAAIRAFYHKLHNGDHKVRRLAAHISAAGYVLPTITEKGNVTRDDDARNKTLYCIALIEDLMDKYGDQRFVQLLTTMSLFTGVIPRSSYLEAIAYALYEAKNPIAPEAFFSARRALIPNALGTGITAQAQSRANSQ